MLTSQSNQETLFAPAERAALNEIIQLRMQLLADKLRAVMLDSIPDPTVALNKERQIIFGNRALLNLLHLTDDQSLLGLRPGEAVTCIHANDHSGGCGTSHFCMQCGAVRSILETLKSRHPYSEECRIRIHANIDGGVLEFRACASLLENQGQDIVLLVMRDISAEKRRKALEKTLFYEVRSSLQNLYGLSQLLMNEPNNREIKEFVRRSSQNLFLQVSQELDLLSLLLSAERGEIQVRPEILSTADLLHALCEELSDMAEARGIQIRLAETAPPVIETDLTLLRAVLRQIVKNAVESTQRGETVTLSAIQQTDEAVLTIHNPGTIPDSVTEQIFMRSFSTKEERGRGIGTYSAKLFTERYLQGHISFTSTVEEGTIFTVRIPHKCSILNDHTSEAPLT